MVTASDFLLQAHAIAGGEAFALPGLKPQAFFVGMRSAALKCHPTIRQKRAEMANRQ
jgi:hypothetical protein